MGNGNWELTAVAEERTRNTADLRKDIRLILVVERHLRYTGILILFPLPSDNVQHDLQHYIVGRQAYYILIITIMAK